MTLTMLARAPVEMPELLSDAAAHVAAQVATWGAASALGAGLAAAMVAAVRYGPAPVRRGVAWVAGVRSEGR